jgi:hypothetical protein
MRVVDTQLSKGLCPRGPPKKGKLVQDEIVRFRLKAAVKARLTAAAQNSDTSVSAILRRAAIAVATGRSLDPSFRSDLVAMRSAANALSAAIEQTSGGSPETLKNLRIAASELHRIAMRQLADMQ